MLTIIAATLLIRPVMAPNSLQVGQLFVSMPFGLLVGLMMDNFSEMAILIETQPVFFQCAPHDTPSQASANLQAVAAELLSVLGHPACWLANTWLRALCLVQPLAMYILRLTKSPWNYPCSACWCSNDTPDVAEASSARLGREWVTLKGC